MEKKKHNVVDGTSYDERTTNKVVEILENCRNNRIRIKVEYGDTVTGKGWGDEYGVTGYVGRSTGIYKVPLLIYNSRSHGGGAMLDHCIVNIATTEGKRNLYSHPSYITGRD